MKILGDAVLKLTGKMMGTWTWSSMKITDTFTTPIIFISSEIIEISWPFRVGNLLLLKHYVTDISYKKYCIRVFFCPVPSFMFIDRFYESGPTVCIFNPVRFSLFFVCDKKVHIFLKIVNRSITVPSFRNTYIQLYVIFGR